MTEEAVKAPPMAQANGGIGRHDRQSYEIGGDIDKVLVEIPDKRGWRKLLAYLGPGFLVCIAYIDPGNFESDLQAGARFQYELLWVLLLASLGGLVIQSLAANLGVVTGHHLAEHCRSEYPPRLNLALWVVAELAIIASDIPEVIGTAFALNMLFGVEVWLGVIVTGFSTLLLLGIQQYGVRKLEAFISALVLIIAFCFMIEVFYARPKAMEVAEGLFMPELSGTGAIGIAISLLGAVVMPHNLFLHSALVLSRKTPRTDRSIREGCLFNLIEMSIALAVAFTINVSVIAVSGAVCSRDDLVPADRANCNSLDLNRAPFLLKNTLGGAASKLFGIALLASGQSSTITGTYAGQYVMQGFLELQYKPWIRNLVTRMVAIVPSLVVAVIGGARGAGELIIISSMILSFQLPFALLPLLKFTSSTVKMGPYINHALVTGGMWALGFFIMAVNVYYLCDIFIVWLGRSSLGLIGLVPIAFFTFSGIVLYICAIVYLAIRKDTEVTFSHPYEWAADESSSDSDVETPTNPGRLQPQRQQAPQELKELPNTNLLSAEHQNSANFPSTTQDSPQREGDRVS